MVLLAFISLKLTGKVLWLSMLSGIKLFLEIFWLMNCNGGYLKNVIFKLWSLHWENKTITIYGLLFFHIDRNIHGKYVLKLLTFALNSPLLYACTYIPVNKITYFFFSSYILHTSGICALLCINMLIVYNVCDLSEVLGEYVSYHCYFCFCKFLMTSIPFRLQLRWSCMLLTKT
jgi:hypothetical protein